MKLTISILTFFTVIFGVSVSVYHLSTTKLKTAVIAPKTGKSIGGSDAAILIPDNLSNDQRRILNFAYKTSKEDGHKHPELLQAIILQESKAGGMKSYKVGGQEFGLKSNERYYGVSQIKLSATRDVLKVFPELMHKHKLQTDTDEEIIAHLIMNDEFNIEIASKYLILIGRHNKDTNFIIAAYNKGVGGARIIGEDIINLDYVKKVKMFMVKH